MTRVPPLHRPIIASLALLAVSRGGEAQSPSRRATTKPHEVVISSAAVFQTTGDTVRLRRVTPGIIILEVRRSEILRITVTDSATRLFVAGLESYASRRALADNCVEPDPIHALPSLIGTAPGPVVGVRVGCTPAGPDSDARTPGTFSWSFVASPSLQGPGTPDLILYSTVQSLRRAVQQTRSLVR